MTRLNLKRDLLAAITGNPRAIRELEKLADFVNEDGGDIEQLTSQVFGAQAVAFEALAKLERISQALEMLATAPRVEHVDTDRLDGLQDVDAGSATAGMVLIYDATAGKWEAADLAEGANISITAADGSIEVAVSAAVVADLTDNTNSLIASSVTLADGAGSDTGTLTNAPAAGDPTKWVAIDDNGTTRYIPAW